MSSFKKFIPVELIKGKDNSGNVKMKMRGIASTKSKDSDGENIDPNGFDLEYFLEHGYMNWNHQSNKDPLSIVGRPTSASVKKDQLHLECELFADNPRAREVYKLGEILQKSGSNLGYSIEGKVLERASMDKDNPLFKIVTKARITGCAITPNPKNQDTIAEIIKGNNFETLSAYNEDEAEKAFTTTSDSGQALAKESVDSNLKVEEYGKKKNEKKLSKGEAFEKILLYLPNIKNETAAKILDLATAIEKNDIMENNTEISDESIEKAYEALGLSTEDSAEGTTEAKVEVDTKDTKEDDNITKGYDCSKMSKDDLEKMVKDAGEALSKLKDVGHEDKEADGYLSKSEDEGDSEDEDKKKKEKDSDIEAKGDEKIEKMESEKEDKKEIKKSEEAESLESKDDDVNTLDLIKSMFSDQDEKLSASNKNIGLLIKGLENNFTKKIDILTNTNETLVSRIQDLEETPIKKSITSSGYLEKASHKNDLSEDVQEISISRNKRQILDILDAENDILRKGEGAGPLGNAIMRFESSGDLIEQAKTALVKKGYKLLK